MGEGLRVPGRDGGRHSGRELGTIRGASSPGSRLPRLVIPASLLVGLTVVPAEEVAPPPPPPLKIEAPAGSALLRQVDGAWVQTFSQGFTAQQGDRRLVGGALRYEWATDQLFATGQPVLVMPGLRIEAKHLGADGRLHAGEAWEVLVQIPGPRATVRLRASHLRFDQQKIVLSHVDADSGHGGLLGLTAESIEIGLADPPIAHRQGLESHLTHLAFRNVQLHLGPLPLLYSPWLYRDFRLDYPWTRYEIGQSSRQGFTARGWTRFDLPPAAGWHLRSMLRLDHYHRVGTAVGVQPLWRHARWGEGQALLYGFDEETVRRSSDGPDLGTRSAWLGDIEHRASFSGGAGYARFTDLPPADPGQPADERFRADYLQDDLEHRVFARRGASVAWSGYGIGLGTTSEAPPDDAAPDLRRELGLRLDLPSVALLGPVHLGGSAEVEKLRDDFDEEEALRQRVVAEAGLSRWLGGGWGWDLVGRASLLGYEDVEQLGTELPDAVRTVPEVEAGTNLRIVGRFDGGVRHRITPRLAVQWSGEGEGDDLPDLDFDQADELEEDLLLGISALDTDVLGSHGRRFRARVVGRWALREDDAPQPEPNSLGDWLHDLELTVEGAPIATWELSGRGLWTGEARDWTTFDARTRWIAHPAVALSLTVSWQEEEESWQYRPGIELTGNRYLLAADLTWEDDDQHQGYEPLRRTGISITRRMVDGDLTLEYAWSRSDDDDIERSILLSFSTDGFLTGY